MKSLITLLLPVALFAQDSADRVTVPFSNPNGPKKVSASLLNGNITVRTHSGKELIVEARGINENRRGRREPPPGMRRIGGGTAGVTIEESNNEVRINLDVFRGGGNLTLQVPADTSLKLNTTSRGNIDIDGTSGEVDVNTLNGNIQIANVSGAVVAHTLNGKLQVSLNQVTPGKPMSFSTFNGEMDVTLPAAAKADFKMRSEHGDIFSDFDIALRAENQPSTETSSVNGKRRYRIRFDRAMYGAINGGGPELQFTTFNGTIVIRKK